MKNKFLFILGMALCALSSCKNNSIQECSPNFFQKYQPLKSINDSITFFSIQPVHRGDSCFYEYEIKSQSGDIIYSEKGPVFLGEKDQQGEMYRKGNIIYAREKYPDGRMSISPHILWDFSLSSGDTVTYEYNASPSTDKIILKTNQVTLDRIIFQENDTIYKFRFINYTDINKYDMIFYVSIESGVIGIYYSSLYDSGNKKTEYIIEKMGYIYETDSNKISK